MAATSPPAPVVPHGTDIGRTLAVSPSRPAIRLAGVVATLTTVASLVGLVWSGDTGPATFVSVRGETVELFGSGLYRYDSMIKATSNQGSDLFALVVGLPLLAYGAASHRRGKIRGTLVFAGVLLWFAYVYLTFSLSTSFNEMFLVYCALVAASSTALVQVVRSIDTVALTKHLTVRFPRRATGIFLATTAGVTLVLWGGISVLPLLQGETPGHLGHATTTVTPALHLGLVVPVLLMAAVTLRRAQDGIGCVVAFPLLLFIASLAPLISVQTAIQLRAGITFAPEELVGLIASFVILGVISVVLAGRTLLSIEEP